MSKSILSRKRSLYLGFLVLLVVSSLGLTLGLNSKSSVEAAPSLPNVPGGLKSTFMLGLGNQPGKVDWMKNSGASWDVRFQYLAGGVNNGGGWSTWNSPAGAFANYYMDDSYNNGYIPAFTYYMMLQSAPASGSSESDKDYNNLNNTGTMYAYYNDFKLLMDRAKIYNKPVIVHVEPDLWGFLQIRSANPNNISAAVASSGYPGLSGLPNTVSGFAKALVTLRNNSAPNVILAYHISPWSSTAGDLSSDKRTNYDVNGAAQQTGGFYTQLGANFDLMFYDIADRDAALYASWGDPNRWWDTNNVAVPNFNRFNQFASTVTQVTGKRGFLWQVPIGNTIYRTVNNTTNHWQDNRVQYYLGSGSNQQLQDLANAGIIGILFGRGDGQTTSNEDAAGDGITNPAPINGNNATSTYSDDDGGLLRLKAQEYYARGRLTLPTGGGVVTPTPTAVAPTATPKPPTATPTAPPTGGGTGLAADYFNNKTLSGSPALQRTDATVNFDWGNGSPGGGLPSDNFSVRWTGQVKAVSSENYTFCTYSDDGVRLWVNNVQVVNNWTDHGPTENCGQIALTKDQSYSLNLEFYENGGGAVSQLRWQTGSIAKQIVPQGQLYPGGSTTTPPTPTPTTVAPTATPTTAPPSAPATWQMSANVSGNLTAGSTITFKSNYTAPTGASGGYILDLEIYDLATGNKVAQWANTGSFTPGQLQSFTNGQAFGAGRYQVRMGVFRSDWSFVAWYNDGPIFQMN